jgi:hypothetical protein
MSDDDWDAPGSVKGFALQMFEYHRAETNFTDALCNAGFGDFHRIGGDYYDSSIEFCQVENDARMSEAAQRVVFDAGYSKAFVNHKDGWETHYSWHGTEFKPARGWRRRYVTDPEAKTTNQIGANDPEQRGYYEISYWPDSWNVPSTKSWLASGYMRIVSDPLDPENKKEDAA